MSLNVAYSFTVLVSSYDARSASQTVVISPTFSGSAQLSITSTFTRFNPALKLVLSGYLSATYAVTSAWSVSTALGVAVPITSLTAQSNSFSEEEARFNINFPLSFDGGIFSGGSAYTFRLMLLQQTICR